MTVKTLTMLKTINVQIKAVLLNHLKNPEKNVSVFNIDNNKKSFHEHQNQHIRKISERSSNTEVSDTGVIAVENLALPSQE